MNAHFSSTVTLPRYDDPARSPDEVAPHAHMLPVCCPIRKRHAWRGRNASHLFGRRNQFFANILRTKSVIKNLVHIF